MTTLAETSSCLVAIGVCTFRRPGLAQTLQSLATQSLRGRVRCCVIVADNDESPSALSIIAQARETHDIDLHYVHAPARNISIARNALLDKAQQLNARYLAMIDDDEFADPNWAENLFATLRDSAAHAVLGRIVAEFRSDAPAWMRSAGLHDMAPEIQRDGRILTGYSGNMMIKLDTDCVKSRRFDLALGQTGGEDDTFFHEMVRDGGMIAYAPDAIVREHVPEKREKLRFLLPRNYRSGQTYATLNTPPGAMRVVYLAKAAAKVAILTAAAGVFFWHPAKRTRALMRASLHLGVCSQVLGGRMLRLYGS
ncbi:glycosyltransferase [Yoonia sp.]|uniref:glycosyltransferase n=1 Tax=Yoonia sp. TaxID=2212373 RepID=UPI00391E0416